ncbi:MAG TPA: acylneuraminate cytidylyltransferase family protein [Exilispira sp.]|nr:acylneuraminate cytidylyltransferase family protein [Exilispira sp.]HPO60398.1 acylneuraminate cytidylyltransferase family protein [Exilispira sp.]
MFKEKTFLAIIPARAGSKRLKNKNILSLNNKPLIQWTVESALGSRFIDKIIISTDSMEIIELAKKMNIPYRNRPTNLAQDESKSVDVAIDVIDNEERTFSYIVFLQPTSPLRKSIHIDEAISLSIEKNANSIISVCETEFNPLWCNKIGKDLEMNNFLPKRLINKRSQDLPIYYRLNGAIYICKTKIIKKYKTFFPAKKSYAYIMDQLSSVDIDTELDFLYAESIFKYLSTK